MYRLPIEIEDIIWELYWMDIFKTNVLDYLKENNDKMLKMDFFLKKHFYPNVNDNYNYQLMHYLKNYNEYLLNIKRDNGLHMFLKRNLYLNTYWKYCDSYINTCSSKINEELKYICSYCLCNCSPYMNYYVLQKFINLSKN